MTTEVKQRIFITGGTGFFGKTILADWKRAPRRDSELVILSRDSTAFLARNPAFQNVPGVSFVTGDIRNFSFPAGDFTAVIHAATPVTMRIDAAEIASIIIDGTRHILDFCKKSGVEKLLYVSSGAVYGAMPPNIERMSENLPCRPTTVYGKSKLIAEQMCLASKMDCVIARCFAFIGEYLPLDLHYAVGNFILDCLQRSICINGDGTAMRSYLYGDDLVRQLWKLLDCPVRPAILNIGSDRAISIWELAKLVRHCAGTENDILIHNRPEANKTANLYIPDITLARSMLEIGDLISLEIALEQVIRFHKDKNMISS